MFANRVNFGLGGVSANAIAQFGQETTITTQLILNFTHAISSELRQYGQRSGCCSRELIGTTPGHSKIGWYSGGCLSSNSHWNHTAHQCRTFQSPPVPR